MYDLNDLREMTKFYLKQNSDQYDSMFEREIQYAKDAGFSDTQIRSAILEAIGEFLREQAPYSHCLQVVWRMGGTPKVKRG